MIAAPRFATLGMNSPATQASSSTASQAFRPPASACTRSGYWVVEWLPQVVIRLISGIGTPSLLASWEMARL
jgi:hypothetical protein